MNAPVDKWELNDARTSVARPRWANDEEWRAAETVPFVPSLPLDDKESQNLDRLAAELAASAAAQFKASVTPSDSESKSERLEQQRRAASAAPSRIYEARTETRADAMDSIPVWMQRPHALQPAVAATTTLPPIHEESRFRLGYAARAFALSVAAAGGVLLAVYGVPGSLRDFFNERSVSSAANESVRAPKTGKIAGGRLVASDIRGIAGEWVPLNMSIDGAMTEGDAIITGFAPGTTLSMGEPYGANAWRVVVGDLPKLQAHLPQTYSGNMDLVVELRRGDAMVIDRRSLRLEAANPKLALASIGRPQPPAPVQGIGPSSASAPARTNEETVVAALPRNATPPVVEEPAAAPVRQIDPAEVAVLVRRGEELVKTGDLSGARLLLQRAADARHAGATFALATTYDPIMLKQMPVLGVSGDVGLARQWYERARDLGIKEATVRLEALARWGR